MANIKSQIKRNRQNEVRRVRNKGIRTALKTSARRVQGSAAGSDPQAATAELRRAARELDKAVSRGVLHRRAAARKKSRLARAVNAAQAETTAE